MTDGLAWAAFDTITGRMYLVESDVPTSVIDIGATLTLITNSDEDRYAFIYCHLFVDKLVGLRAFETYETQTIEFTFCGQKFSKEFIIPNTELPILWED